MKKPSVRRRNALVDCGIVSRIAASVIILGVVWSSVTVAQGQESQGQVTQGQATQDQATQGQATQDQATQGQATQGQATQGSEVDELTQCRTLSQVLDEIHNCLDNFLDQLDLEMQALELEVVDQLGGQFSPLAMSFADAQTAYREYRASNCLWYQSFSSPIDLAQQIAKACLIGMSHSRMTEINDLLRVNTAEGPNAVKPAEPSADDQASEVAVAGYYLYGVDRNSFQPCGTAARYWVEGDQDELTALQLAYRENTADDNPLLFVELTGTPDTDLDSKSFPGHEGVFKLSNLLRAKPSFEGDCAQSTVAASMTDLATVPATSTEEEVDLSQLTSSVAKNSAELAVAPEVFAANQPATPAPEPEVQESQSAGFEVPPLVAYFGDWTAKCSYLGSSFGCELSVAMTGNSVPDILRPVLTLVRRTNKRTIVDLSFPGQEIASASKIRWTIDSNVLGVLTESRLFVGDTAVVQQLRQRAYIQRQLLPAMVAGYTLVVTVIDEVEGPIPYTGTLVGLTRALAFADRYAESGGKI